MKYSILFSFILLSTFLTSQENRNKNQKVWLSADNVNLRDAPKNGGVLINLPIGSELIFKGSQDGWAYVAYTKGEKKIDGYVLEEFIAENACYEEKSQNLFLFRTLSVEKNKHGMDVSKIEIRVSNGNKELAKTFVYGEREGYFYTSVSDGKQLSDVQNVIKLDFPQECCACPGGTSYLFWNGKQIINAFSVSDGVDVPAFGKTALIFPDDHGGLSNTIIMLYFSGEINEGDDDKIAHDFIDYVQAEFHYWDGEKLKKFYPLKDSNKEDN